MNKIIDLERCREHIKDGMTLMIGGFMTLGTPMILMDALVRWGLRGLTIICNDAGYPNQGVGKLITAGCVRKIRTTHMGLNPEVGKLLNAGKIEVELIPMGTLVEQIRAGGAGLGGILTQTGLGTTVAEGKTIVTVDGKDFLLEKPIRADVALLRGSVVDTFGNALYNGTTRNFNPVMATAADTVIMAAEKIVELGEIAPEAVVTPGIFVDYIIGGEAYGC